MKRPLLLILAASLMSCLFFAAHSRATIIPAGDFSLEVSPSPLTITVEPGKAATVELKIRNASLKPEQLKIEARNFTINNTNQDIALGDSTPADLAAWVQYAQPTFTVQPGQWYTQKITITLPQSVGFSYSFAVVISRANHDTTATGGNRLLKGSVAVFTLVNVNKPGATRTIELESITTTQPIYEYLPAEVRVHIKNTGNSIVQPYGNIYIQRNATSTTPLAVLPLNDARSYILPGSSKTFTVQWSDGWPVYRQESGKRSVDWDDGSTSQFRIGKYTAKVVAVYNDGARDVPVTGEVSFWVTPWKLLLGILLLISLVVFGIWSIIRQIAHKIKRLREHA